MLRQMANKVQNFSKTSKIVYFREFYPIKTKNIVYCRIPDSHKIWSYSQFTVARHMELHVNHIKQSPIKMEKF